MALPPDEVRGDKTRSLVAKLRHHRITKAWAGNFEALFSKSINEVNARLAEECRVNGEGILIPFGTVNPAWPDWEEDLRRCHEVHRMPGIRLYPAYQTFDLNHNEFIPSDKPGDRAGIDHPDRRRHGRFAGPSPDRSYKGS